MDSSSLYTYQNLINAIELRALGDPQGLSSGNNQYSIYAQLINNLAIPEWEGQRGLHWNELWVPQDNFVTITANMTSVALPDDFREMGGGFIVLTYPGGTAASPNNKPLPVKKLNEQVLNPFNNKMEFYVSGNRLSGFELIFGWTPQTGDSEIGATLSFTYYKYASILSNPTDVPEMADPQFIIFRVVAEVSGINYNTTLFATNDARATASMKNMIVANEGSANFQDNYVKDVDALLGRHSVINRLNSGYWTR